MRLDPIDQHNAVGLVSIAVEVDGETQAVRAQRDGVHLRTHRAADRLFRHAELGEQAALPFSGAASVAPHRGHNERGESERSKRLDGRSHHEVDPGNPPAADRQRDRSTLRNTIANAGFENRAGDGLGRIRNLGLVVEVLANAGDERKRRHDELRTMRCCGVASG